MALYDLTQLDGLRPEDFADYTRTRLLEDVRQPERIGERILPFRNVNEYKLKVGTVTFRPVASGVIAPNATLPKGPLGTFSEAEYQLLKIGLEYAMIETELIKLRELLAPGATISLEGLMNSEPYRLLDALRTGWLDRNEMIRWALLANDSYTIPNTGINITWNIPAANKFDVSGGTDAWSDVANADGLGDLEEMNQVAIDTYGTPISIYVMSTQEFNQLTSQTKTQQKLMAVGLLGLGAQLRDTTLAGSLGGLIGPEMIGRFLSLRRQVPAGNDGPVSIVIYDKTFQDFDFYGNAQPVQTRFLPGNKVVGLSGRPLQGPVIPNPTSGTSVGYMADGPVAENDFRQGLFTWMDIQMKPVQVSINSAGWAFPIADHRTIYQLTTS